MNKLWITIGLPIALALMVLVVIILRWPSAETVAPPKTPATDAENAEVQERLQAAIFVGRSGELVAAERDLEALAQDHPEHPSIWLNLGIARTGLGKLEEAEKAFRKVLELSPDDWDGVAELANIALERGQLEQALDLAERIPTGKGRLRARLRHDPRWSKYRNQSRVIALRKKHGLTGERDRSEKVAHELATRRAQAKAKKAAQRSEERPVSSSTSASSASSTISSTAVEP